MKMENLNGCQLPCLPKIAEGKADFEPQPFIRRLKRTFARPWNYYGKKYLKQAIMLLTKWQEKLSPMDKVSESARTQPVTHLKAGDLVRVRSLEEIQGTLNRFKELKGCAFLEEMKQYCGSTQRVVKVMERFLDERDYQVKKTRGIVLLEGVYCQGTPVFGRCDRSCLLFWREEWLEIIPA
jgi:hypothetical protein